MSDHGKEKTESNINIDSFFYCFDENKHLYSGLRYYFKIRLKIFFFNSLHQAMLRDESGELVA